MRERVDQRFGGDATLLGELAQAVALAPQLVAFLPAAGESGALIGAHRLQADGRTLVALDLGDEAFDFSEHVVDIVAVSVGGRAVGADLDLGDHTGASKLIHRTCFYLRTVIRH